MEIKFETKQRIAESLRTYVGRYPSQNKAAQSLKGISAGTISAILNGKWGLISDDMWANLCSQLGMGQDWTLVNTFAHDGLITYFNDAREDSLVLWITGPAGIGKSTAAREYAQGHHNVFLLPCSEDMHKSDFVGELAQKLGVSSAGMTVRETLRAIIREVTRLESPLLIFDEGDKLTDSVLYYFISLYNALEEKCGMVFLSTDYIRKRVARGVAGGRKGYDKLESRICRRFVSLVNVSSEEVRQICLANGLTKESGVARVVAEAAECDNDLRRVKRCVHRELKRASREQ